jgi:hypothetical protein
MGYESNWVKRRRILVNDSTVQHSYSYLGLFEICGLYGYSRVVIITQLSNGYVHSVSYWSGDSTTTNKHGVAKIQFDYFYESDGLRFVQSNFDESGNLVVGTGASAFAQGHGIIDSCDKLLALNFLDSQARPISSTECRECRLKDFRDAFLDTDLGTDMHW